MGHYAANDVVRSTGLGGLVARQCYSYDLTAF